MGDLSIVDAIAPSNLSKPTCLIYPRARQTGGKLAIARGLANLRLEFLLLTPF
ncbi:hypothetical protein QM565_34730 [Geitlerinema splendidum]|nr:hypothetical protein [Geitlerinema splendidum]